MESPSKQIPTAQQDEAQSLEATKLGSVKELTLGEAEKDTADRTTQRYW